LGNQKKEIILVAGVLLFMIGLLGTGLPLIYSVIVAVGIYVGVKVFVGRRQQLIAKEIPEGICAECGSKISAGNCPNCNDDGKKEN
jgi:Flp pilus assembly protein TadB